MFEVKITASPELVQAINNLAAALSGVRFQAAPATAPTANPTPTPAPAATVPPTGAPAAPATPAQPTAAPASTAPMTAPTAYPSNPQGYAAPSANPTPAGGYAAPAQTGAPAAQTAGPNSAYPSNPPAAQGASYSAPVPQPQAAGVPLAQPPQYTIDQIMAAGATLMDAGRVDDLMNLLRSFGVQAVTDLKPEQMGAFATALRSLGARI